MIDLFKRTSKPYQNVQGIARSSDGRRTAIMRALGSSVEVYNDDTMDVTSLARLRTIANPAIIFLNYKTLVTFPAVSSAANTMLDIWDVEESRLIRSIVGINPHAGAVDNRARVFCLSESDSTLVVLCSRPGIQVLVITETREWTSRKIDISSLGIRCDVISSVACFSNGSLAALGSVQGNVYIVDYLEVKLLKTINVYDRELAVGVAALAVSPDDNMLAAGPTAQLTISNRSVLNRERIEHDAQILRLGDDALVARDNSSGPVRQFSWSPDANRLAIARDGSVTILDVKGQRRLELFPTSSTSTVTFLDDNNVAFNDEQIIKTHQLTF